MNPFELNPGIPFRRTFGFELWPKPNMKGALYEARPSDSCPVSDG